MINAKTSLGKNGKKLERNDIKMRECDEKDF